MKKDKRSKWTVKPVNRERAKDHEAFLAGTYGSADMSRYWKNASFWEKNEWSRFKEADWKYALTDHDEMSYCQCELYMCHVDLYTQEADSSYEAYLLLCAVKNWHHLPREYFERWIYCCPHYVL